MSDSRWSKLSPEERAFEVEWRREYNRRWRIAKKWNMTVEEFDALIPEDGLCPICRKVPELWVMDHDHTTNEKRGLLCKACNLGMGGLGDDIGNLARAMLWLLRHQTSSEKVRKTIV